MSIVKNLLIRAGADFSSMRTELVKAKNDLDKFKNGVGKAVAGIAAALAGIGAGLGIKSAVQDAMKYEASLQQINRMMQTSAGEFKKWAEESATAFGISRKEAVEYGAVFSNLIGTFSTTSSEVKDLTTDILKASAVISGATGRDMEDVMFRIRSGLLGNTEAIEDLGVNVNVSMLESTEAFKKFANGKSWLQLSFQTQQQIRLFGILEQSAKKYGTEVAVNTASNLGTFVAIMRNVKLSIGQAFMPLLNIAIPILTKFALILDSVMRVVAQFSQALFGKASNVNAQAKAMGKQAAAAANVGDAYKKAGKKAKEAADNLQGFDQVNTIKEPSGSGSKDGEDDPSAGLSGIAPEDLSLGGLAETTLEVPEKIQAMADRIKGTFSSLVASITIYKDQIVSAFVTAGQFIVDSFIKPLIDGGIRLGPVLGEWGKALKASFLEFLTLGEPLKNWIINDLVPLWQKGVDIVSSTLGGLLDSALKVFNSIREAVAPILMWFVTDGLPLISSFASGVMDLFRSLFDIAKKIFDDIWSGAIDPAMKLVSKIIIDALNIIKDFWNNWGVKIVDGILVALDKIKTLWTNLWDGFLKPFITNMLSMLTQLWDKHLKGLVQEVVNFVGKLVSAALDIFNKFIMPIVDYLVKLLGPTFSNMFSFIVDVAGSAIGAIADILKGVFKILGGIVDFIAGIFTGDWKRAWDGVKDVFEGIWDAVVGVLKGAVNLIIDLINFVIRQLNNVKIDVPEPIAKLLKMSDTTFGFKIPELPKLARGGVVDTQTNMGNYIAGESGAEMIVPLENTSFTDKIAAALGSAVMTAMTLGQGQGQGDIVVQIGGVEVARAIQPYTKQENNRLGGSMIVTT